MQKSLTIWFLLIYPILLFSQEQEEVEKTPVSIKFNLISLLHKDISIEIEKYLNEQTSIIGGIAYIEPYQMIPIALNIKKDGDIKGIGGRFGTKHYLFKKRGEKKMKGLAFKPQVLLQFYEHDGLVTGSQTSHVTAQNQISATLLVSIGYQFAILKRLVMEVETGAGNQFYHRRYKDIIPAGSSPTVIGVNPQGMFSFNVGYYFNIKKTTNNEK